MQKVRPLRGPGPQQASPSRAAQWGRRATGLPLRGRCSMPPSLAPGDSEQAPWWERACSVSSFSYQAILFLRQKAVLPFPVSTSPPFIPSSSPSHCSPPPPPNVDSCFLHWIPNATPSRFSSSFLSRCCYLSRASSFHTAHLSSPPTNADSILNCFQLTSSDGLPSPASPQPPSSPFHSALSST